MPEPCVNCGRPCPPGRRRLCRACHDDPAIRDAHPAGGRNGVRNGVGVVTPSRVALPTDAIPGTAEKVAVLAERARLGLALWHPRDARLGDAAPAGGPRDEDEEAEEGD